MLIVERAIESAYLKRENQELKIKARITPSLVGNSPSTHHIRQTISKIGPTNGRCFITGPVGSDKEAIAREIHSLSKRSQKPLLP